MTTLRLTLRLIHGGGRRGAARLLLMTAGITLGTAVLLLVWAVPHVLSGRADRLAERAPHPAMTPAATAFRYETIDDEWQDEGWTRVLIADVRSPAVPPGLSRLPRPGEVFVSPALARRMRDPLLAAHLPGRPAGLIAPAGLAAPDELLAYVGVRSGQLDGGGSAASGFGVSSAPGDGVGGAGIGLALLVLVGPCLAIYLSTCARLSATARSRRLAALRLLGATRGEVLGITALEAAASGCVGALVGVALFAAADPILASSGLFGFRWFAADGRPTPAGVGLVVVLVAGAAAAFGITGMKHALGDALTARRAGDEGRGSAFRLLPLLLGGSTLVCLAAIEIASPRRHGSTIGEVAVAAGALAVLGTLLALRYLLVAIADGLAGRARRLALRVAARRVSSEVGGVLRVLAGLILLVVTAGTGTCVLRDTYLAAGPQATTRAVSVDGSDVTQAAARDRLAHLDAGEHFVVVRSVTRHPVDRQPPQTAQQFADMLGVPEVYATCATLRRVTSARLDTCRDGTTYRLGDDDPATEPTRVSPGVVARYRTDTGQRQVTAPQRTLVVPGLWASTLPTNALVTTTSEAPAGGWGDGASFTWLVPASSDHVEKLQADILGITPAGRIDLGDLNLPALAAYRVHRGAVLTGIAASCLLGIVAFVVAFADRTIERRRDTSVLTVLGTPHATLRRIQLAQLALPLLPSLTLAILLGQLIGQLYLTASGLQQGYYADSLRYGLLVSAGCLIVTITAAAFVPGTRLHTEDLRRE